jgi:hypothetical protein
MSEGVGRDLKKCWGSFSTGQLARSSPKQRRRRAEPPLLRKLTNEQALRVKHSMRSVFCSKMQSPAQVHLLFFSLLPACRFDPVSSCLDHQNDESQLALL